MTSNTHKPHEATESVRAIGHLSREIISEDYRSDVYVFDDVWAKLATSKDLSEVQTRVRIHLEVSELAPRAHRAYEHDDVVSASWHTINVMCHLYDKIRRVPKDMGDSALAELVDEAILETDTPRWLGGRLLNLVPRILRREQIIEAPGNELQQASRPYVVYCGNELPVDCGMAELKKYRILARKNQFEIVMDDIGESRHIQIAGCFDLIRPGDGYPYRILRYLLSRVGRDVTYKDIRRQLWTESEVKSRKNLSRVIRDRIEHIRLQVRTQSDSLESEPAEWFQRTPVRGVIRVWADLNSCLMTTRSALRRKSV